MGATALRKQLGWRLGLALATAAVAGCGGEGAGDGGHGAGVSLPDCEAPPDPQPFEIGTGELCFERVTPGQTITQWSGPQGGYHMFLAIGCTDCNVSTLIRYTLRDSATLEPIPGGE